MVEPSEDSSKIVLGSSIGSLAVEAPGRRMGSGGGTDGKQGGAGRKRAGSQQQRTAEAGALNRLRSEQVAARLGGALSLPTPNATPRGRPHAPRAQRLRHDAESHQRDAR